MLRMGRSPRVEPAEQEKPPVVQPPQTFQPAAPQAPPQRVAERPAAVTQPSVAEAERPQSARPETEQRPSSPRAVSETEGLARDLREGILSGFVGGGTVLTGDAEFKGMLRIDGRFTGRITSEKGTLIVSAGGRVDANLWVGTAKVNGVVNGDITAAERIELGRSAQVRGQIQTPTLVVEQGAIFEGGCRMTRAEPAKAERSSETAAASARPQTPSAPPRPRPTAAPQTQPLTAPRMPAAAADAGGGASAQLTEVSKAAV